MNATIETPKKVRPASSYAFHGKYLDADPVEFREKFNRKHFPFSHRLENHPLFDLERLSKLSETLPADDIYNADGGSRVDGKFSRERTQKWTPREAIANVQQSGSWCVQYAPMVRTSLSVLGRLMRMPALRQKRQAIDSAASEDAWALHGAER